MFSSNNPNDSIDGELVRKSRKTCEKITESIYVTANEPTLACFRIQEHIHRTNPILADKKTEMIQNELTLRGILYDIEYTKDSIESLRRSKDHFDTIQRLVKDSIYFKQQTDYDENVRRRVQEKIQQQNKQQELLSEKSSPQSTSATTNYRRERLSAPSSKTNLFNRFSVSFDFSHSIPMVASSVSADIKSLLNQLTSDSVTNENDGNTSINLSKNPNTTQTVTASKSLHILPDDNDENNVDTNAKNELFLDSI